MTSVNVYHYCFTTLTFLILRWLTGLHVLQLLYGPKIHSQATMWTVPFICRIIIMIIQIWTRNMNTEKSRNNDLGISTSMVQLLKKNGLNKDNERVFRFKIKEKWSVSFFQDFIIFHFSNCNKQDKKYISYHICKFVHNKEMYTLVWCYNWCITHNKTKIFPDTCHIIFNLQVSKDFLSMFPSDPHQHVI